MSNEVKFNVKMTTSDMYSFLLKHTYSSVQGLFGVFLSLMALLLLITTWNDGDDTKRMILIFISLLFTIVNPIMLWLKAKRQVLANPIYKNELTYIFNKKGIKVVQGETEAEIEWKDVKKVTMNKKLLLVYTSNIYAFIFPKKAIGNQLDNAYDILKNQLDNNIKRPKILKR